MAYGALMRIFAAQGRPEKALDLLDEIMMQMMMPVNAENVLSTKGGDREILKNIDGDDDGWYDDREG
jgi:pentatricopeptide repeat protein